MENVTRNLVIPPATAKGHLNQEKQHLQSTKNTELLHQIDDDTDFFPLPDTTPPIRTNNIMALVVPFRERNTTYSDQTGRFPHISSRGNAYLLIVYDYDSNAILVEPLKSRAAAGIKNAWLKINTFLESRGRKPDLHILDNECAAEFKHALTKNKIQYQLVPPHVHRRNAAERAIQTFKHHFLAGLASADPDFPVAEWDRLLPQAVLTLNLLRNSRVNPKLSSHAFLHGNFDFNATPLAPPATKVVIHNKPKDRNSWSFHGRDGWYVSYAPEHYRCVTCLVSDTRHEVVSDTVQFFPHQVPMPECSTTDFLKKAALDIVTLLQNRRKYLPGLEDGDKITAAYEHIATILNRSDDKPIPHFQRLHHNLLHLHQFRGCRIMHQNRGCRLLHQNRGCRTHPHYPHKRSQCLPHSLKTMKR